MGIQVVEDMPVYRLLYRLALRVEKETRCFGPDFRWLRSQMLRSSEGACSNMAEGFYSQYSTKYLQYLHISRREARETVTHLAYARDAGQLGGSVVGELLSGYDDALQQLSKLMASVEDKVALHGKGKPPRNAVREDDEVYPAIHESPSVHQPSTINHGP